MMRCILIAFITILSLNSHSNAATTTYSDSCATLSLTGPDTDPGNGYIISASGKVNSGYSYYAWFYVDGVYTSYSNSFFSTSFAKDFGPFTGPHTYKMTIQGGGSMNLCKRSVELTVAPPKKDLSVSIGAVTTPTNVSVQTISGSMDSGAIVSVTTDSTASAGTIIYPTPTTWNCTISGLVEGSNVITATASDPFGNNGTVAATILYDITAPTVSIDTLTTPTNKGSQTISGTAENGSAITLTANTGAYFGAINYTTPTAWNSTIYGLVEGVNAITATARDAAGNKATAAAGIIYDVTAPTVSINPVATPADLNAQTLSGAVESGAAVTLLANTALSFGAIDYPTPLTWECPVIRLAEGPNIITAVAKDAAGNIATAAAAITYVVSPKEVAANICATIRSAPDNAFKNNPLQRKNALCEKTDEVIELIRDAENSTDNVVQQQFYQDAVEKLSNDIGAKMDGFAGGDPKNDWITDKQAQTPIYRTVQKLIKELQDQL